MALFRGLFHNESHAKSPTPCRTIEDKTERNLVNEITAPNLGFDDAITSRPNQTGRLGAFHSASVGLSL